MEVPSDNVADAPATTQAPPPPESTNDHDDQLSLDLKQLSLTTNSTTNLPSSPQVGASPQRRASLAAQRNYPPPSPSNANGNRPPRSPLERSGSSTGVGVRSSTPTLNKKSSMGSLQGVGGVTPPRQSVSRRTSMQLQTGLGAMPKSPLSGLEDAPPAPPPITAASIASSHFKSELEQFHSNDNTDARSADTIVVLHDACYGHRYSRPRTSRAGLSTIVERPERIHASIVGLSVAYVRLGERHSKGEYALHPKKHASSIPSIPFRIRKTSRKMPLSSPAVTNVHGTKWMEELKIMCDSAESKLAANGKELTRPEMTRSPDQGAPSKFHEGDLYLCSESLDAMEGALGAVCDGVDAVFHGTASGKGPHRAFVAIRPPGHHCSASYPSGFCWVNNVHVGISHAALNYGLTHAAMIDFDLHHGDGSQAITWEHNMRGTGLPKNAAAWKKTSIGYFSLHDINSYPCEMGDPEKVKNASLCIENAHGQNIWNVHLQSWKSEQEFWELYETKYSVLLEKTRNFLRSQTQRLRSVPNGPRPRACIFLSAGFDASEWESSGMQRHKVNVPTEFYARIARDVVKLAAEEDCAVDGRVISVLEGGYSDRALSSGVLSHMSGLAGSDPAPVKKEDATNGLGYSMSQATPQPGLTPVTENGKDTTREYDPTWWAIQNLEALDEVMRPPPPPMEPKKARDFTPSTYSSPTQSFSAKVVQSPTLRRSSSNLSASFSKVPSRPASPPPPEVEWTTAAHELSKLLIPTNRQTKSCTVEDLAAEATKIRKQIAGSNAAIDTIATTTGAPVRMSLRERKAKPLSTANEEEESEKMSRANRRKTVAGGAVIAAERAAARNVEPSYAQSTKSSRRLSLASNSGSTTSATPGNRAPSVGAVSIPPRPGSSQSVRPGSSMSSRGTSVPPAPVVVKKTRPTAATTKAPRAPRKSPAVEASNPLGPTKPASTRVSSASSGVPTSATGSDLDSLTNCMKKVSITLTTKAQREARERDARENAGTVDQDTSEAPASKPVRASPKKTTTAPRKPAVPKSAAPRTAVPKTVVPKTSVPKKQSIPPASASVPPNASVPSDSAPSDSVPQTPVETPSTSSTPSGLEQAQGPATPQSSHFQPIVAATPSGVPLPPSIPATPQYQAEYTGPPPSAPSPPPTSATSSGSNVFIPYQPEGPTPMADVTKGQGLTWLEPNTGTPAKFKQPIPDVSGPGLEKNKLPNFTSTSTIPFGVKKEHDDSIWEVPDTPQKK